MKRLDTRLESEGAEFLVLGQLLLNRIAAYKTYTNMPGYDLVAADPKNGTSARIQVKSRWQTGASGFPIKNFDCEFVVGAFLNRGTKDDTSKARAPEYFVFPVEILRALPRSDSWSKVFLRQIPNREHYRENWALIASYLATGSSIETTRLPRRGTTPER